MEAFWRYVDEGRQARGLSWLALEKEAGLSNGAITKRYKSLDVPSARVCTAIAKVFTVPAEDVMRRAGILPRSAMEAVEGGASYRELLAIMRQLSDRERDDLLMYARYRLTKSRGK